jgi:hypothetical protein
MRVMMMIKADPDPGATPSEELLTEMGRYNDELQKAGVLVDLAGAAPERRGAAGEVLERDPHRDRRAIPRPEAGDRGLLDPSGAVDRRGRRMGRTFPIRGAIPDLPGEYGAEGVLELRQVFEPEE